MMLVVTSDAHGHMGNRAEIEGEPSVSSSFM